MFRIKLLAFISLITFALGIALVGDALAGEKVKFRTGLYGTKWEQVAVGDKEGHIIGIYESKGLGTNLEGKKFLDGWLLRESGLMDIDGKAGTWSAQGYADFTDENGDMIYVAWEGKKMKQDQPGTGTVRLLKGTGKWQGIQGKGTWVAVSSRENRSYSNVEWDVELPR